MPVVTLAEESQGRGHGFYVPQFEIRVTGAGLPHDVLRDVVEVTYKDKLEEIDGCELTVNNWDSATASFKYIGSEAELTGGGPDIERYKLFEPCSKEVEVRLGYQGELESMMRGSFTTMEPNFSSTGPPTLQVRILNVLHQLRRKKYDGQWNDKKDSDIAEQIATLRDAKAGNAPRFPLPIVTNAKAKKAEEPLFYVGQKSEYDIDFLWKRARIHGYVVVIQEESDEHPRQLYFGPSLEADDQVTYRLEWGKSMIDFKPTLTTANQFKSVTVRGWDRTSQKAIEEKVDFTDPELAKLNKNLHEMIVQCDPREEFVVEKPVYTKNEAKDLARSLLLDQHKRMVKATATTVGLPKLRAGSKVEILGVGSRLSGIYFVTETTHTLNSSGYTTRFQARREDPDSGVMK
jgi:phage protein D